MSELPIHFFSIVLNGQPFIEYHLPMFQRLPFDWHWHIVEGVAEHHHDTKWGRDNGGCITAEMHKNGLSNDGTSEYMDMIAKAAPDKVTIYRKPFQKTWDGKLEMVNAPLVNIKEECLLWEVDVDEIWQAHQIEDMHAMFKRNPGKTAALYRCWYFVGPDLIITNVECYGNYGSEWLRTWHYKPGDRWAAHEPPKLVRFGMDVGKIYPFTQAETSMVGRFQHFAYATEKQLAFKEHYYGYKDAVSGWRRLQRHETHPCALDDFFGWVKDGAMVSRASYSNIAPLIQI